MTTTVPPAPAAGARRPGRRRLAHTVLVAVAALGAALLSPAAPASAAAPPVVGPKANSSVTADVLPAPQINGVGWTQVVAGNTVFVGGEFGKARPAGVKPGGAGQVVRKNLLSYDIRTGVLTDFAPNVAGAVKGLAVSPDGTRLYVAGAFSKIDGQQRYRLAAFDIATGELVPGFLPVFDYIVNTVVASGNQVYVGGAFTHVGRKPRERLAALRASDGALTAWAPSADNQVASLIRAPKNGPIVVAGTFGNLSSSGSTQNVEAHGLGAIDARTGAVVSWSANQKVQSWGGKAGFTSLSTDGKLVYGTAYNYSGSGNLEGSFAADATGRLVWVEDCHGDTYDSYPMGGLLYTVGHAHDCGRIGGFVESNVNIAHRALAFTTAVRGTLDHNTVAGYADWGGTPAPALTTWFPNLMVGTYTGASQAAWSITGNGTYVVLAGEFPKVGGVAQQGLVRFALRGTAPAKIGPSYSDTPPFTLTASPGSVTLKFNAASDPDDLQLTYTIVRDGVHVGTVRASSTFWDRPALSFVDRKVPAGRHDYQLRTNDPDDNVAWTQPISVTVPRT